MDNVKPPCLSVQQPWASLLVLGIKDVENRTWPTRYRGPLRIHAGKAINGEQCEDVVTWEITPEQAELLRSTFGRLTIGAFPRGGIIGVVELVDCVQNSQSKWANHEEGTWHWLVKPVEHHALIPCKGALGLFQPTVRHDRA